LGGVWSERDRGLRVNNGLPGELPFRMDAGLLRTDSYNIAPCTLRSISPKEPNRKRRSEASADQPLSFISQDSGYFQRLGLQVAVGMASLILLNTVPMLMLMPRNKDLLTSSITQE
jgi:hypothetical protein